MTNWDLKGEISFWILYSKELLIEYRKNSKRVPVGHASCSSDMFAKLYQQVERSRKVYLWILILGLLIE